jgi:hypothetical protein
MKKRLAFELILAMFLVATPALAGGAAIIKLLGFAQTTNATGYINSESIGTAEIVSGVDPSTWGRTVCQSYVENSTTIVMH